MQKTAAEINLGTLADNGGPTQTMALLAGSVAIDAGDDLSCPATDQRGVLRPQGAHCDIGAYESAVMVDLESSVNPSVYGQSVTFTATVLEDGSIPTGTVTFKDGGSEICSGVPLSSGVATCIMSSISVGDHTISAKFIGDSGSSGSDSLIQTVNKANQTITVTPHALSSAAYNTSFTAAATGGGSGNPVTYSSAGGCTNVGAEFTMTSGTGTCTVKYDQAGNDNYDAAPQVTETVTAQKAGQTITVNTHSPANAAYNGSFNVTATAAPGLDVAITSSGDCSGIGIGSALITMTCGTLPCTVHYNQPGDSNYNAASEIIETAAVRSVLTITPAGTGIGAVSGNGTDCSWDGSASESSGTCLVCYNNDVFDLNIEEGACSFFDGWETAYSESGNSSDVTATFALYPLVRLSSSQGRYATISEAYTNSPDGGTIQIQAHTFLGEDLLLNGPGKNVTFDSGWNCDYTRLSGSAAARGLTIVEGSIVFKNGPFVIGS